MACGVFQREKPGEDIRRHGAGQPGPTPARAPAGEPPGPALRPALAVRFSRPSAIHALARHAGALVISLDFETRRAPTPPPPRAVLGVRIHRDGRAACGASSRFRASRRSASPRENSDTHREHPHSTPRRQGSFEKRGPDSHSGSVRAGAGGAARRRAAESTHAGCRIPVCSGGKRASRGGSGREGRGAEGMLNLFAPHQFLRALRVTLFRRFSRLHTGAGEMGSGGLRGSPAANPFAPWADAADHPFSSALRIVPLPPGAARRPPGSHPRSLFSTPVHAIDGCRTTREPPPARMPAGARGSSGSVRGCRPGPAAAGRERRAPTQPPARHPPPGPAPRP
jgi:hypothetical protein